jgi:hypothetical protein
VQSTAKQLSGHPVGWGVHAMFEAQHFNASFTTCDQAGATNVAAVAVFQP